MKHKKTYADMERHPGDMTDFRRPAYAVKRAIRAQGEQIRENPAEYVARKYGIGGNTVDKGNATELPEQKG